MVLYSGCNSSDRVPLSGQVTVNGQDLAEGYIQFRPLQGTASPTAGAEIKAGRYEVAGERGIHAGKFRVEIRAIKQSNRKMVDAVTDDTYFASYQFLPARFNTASELVAEVDKKQTTHDFDLEISQETSQ